MARFVESAVLKVVDQSSGPLNKIKRALADFFKHAKAGQKDLGALSKDASRLKFDAAGLRAGAAAINEVRAAARGAAPAVRTLDRAMRSLNASAAKAARLGDMASMLGGISPKKTRKTKAQEFDWDAAVRNTKLARDIKSGKRAIASRNKNRDDVLSESVEDAKRRNAAEEKAAKKEKDKKGSIPPIAATPQGKTVKAIEAMTQAQVAAHQEVMKAQEAAAALAAKQAKQLASAQTTAKIEEANAKKIGKKQAIKELAAQAPTKPATPSQREQALISKARDERAAAEAVHKEDAKQLAAAQKSVAKAESDLASAEAAAAAKRKKLDDFKAGEKKAKRPYGVKTNTDVARLDGKAKAAEGKVKALASALGNAREAVDKYAAAAAMSHKSVQDAKKAVEDAIATQKAGKEARKAAKTATPIVAESVGAKVAALAEKIKKRGPRSAEEASVLNEVGGAARDFRGRSQRSKAARDQRLGFIKNENADRMKAEAAVQKAATDSVLREVEQTATAFRAEEGKKAKRRKAASDQRLRFVKNENADRMAAEQAEQRKAARTRQQARDQRLRFMVNEHNDQVRAAEKERTERRRSSASLDSQRGRAHGKQAEHDWRLQNDPAYALAQHKKGVFASKYAGMTGAEIAAAIEAERAARGGGRGGGRRPPGAGGGGGEGGPSNRGHGAPRGGAVFSRHGASVHGYLPFGSDSIAGMMLQIAAANVVLTAANVAFEGVKDLSTQKAMVMNEGTTPAQQKQINSVAASMTTSAPQFDRAETMKQIREQYGVYGDWDIALRAAAAGAKRNAVLANAMPNDENSSINLAKATEMLLGDNMLKTRSGQNFAQQVQDQMVKSLIAERGLLTSNDILQFAKQQKGAFGLAYKLDTDEGKQKFLRDMSSAAMLSTEMGGAPVGTAFNSISRSINRNLANKDKGFFEELGLLNEDKILSRDKKGNPAKLAYGAFKGMDKSLFDYIQEDLVPALKAHGYGDDPKKMNWAIDQLFNNKFSASMAKVIAAQHERLFKNQQVVGRIPGIDEMHQTQRSTDLATAGREVAGSFKNMIETYFEPAGQDIAKVANKLSDAMTWAADKGVKNPELPSLVSKLAFGGAARVIASEIGNDIARNAVKPYDFSAQKTAPTEKTREAYEKQIANLTSRAALLRAQIEQAKAGAGTADEKKTIVGGLEMQLKGVEAQLSSFQSIIGRVNAVLLGLTGTVRQTATQLKWQADYLGESKKRIAEGKGLSGWGDKKGSAFTKAEDEARRSDDGWSSDFRLSKKVAAQRAKPETKPKLGADAAPVTIEQAKIGTIQAGSLGQFMSDKAGGATPAPKTGIGMGFDKLSDSVDRFSQASALIGSHILETAGPFGQKVGASMQEQVSGIADKFQHAADSIRTAMDGVGSKLETAGTSAGNAMKSGIVAGGQEAANAIRQAVANINVNVINKGGGSNVGPSVQGKG